MSLRGRFSRKLTQPVDILPLALFRIAFGLLMGASALRFVLNGWVEAVYLAPEFHFSYLGFDWVKPLPGAGMHALYACLMALAWHPAAWIAARVPPRADRAGDGRQSHIAAVFRLAVGAAAAARLCGKARYRRLCRSLGDAQRATEPAADRSGQESAGCRSRYLAGGLAPARWMTAAAQLSSSQPAAKADPCSRL